MPICSKTTLRADFKSYKTKKVTTAKVPVTVAEEVLALKSVEAKGVKTLVATFNKAVDTEKATVAVKKGTSTSSIASSKWAEDKKSVTITTSSKLTEGTYTVSITGLTEAALTGDVAVKDETLTSIEVVGTNLVASTALGLNTTIGFKTLNQYGERIAGAQITPSSSFGTASVNQDCTTTKNGEIAIVVSTQTLAIYGTNGSITLVDKTTGINTTATITYSAPAAAKTMTVAGLYNKAELKVMNMTKGDDASDYVVLATAEDQYGNALNAKKMNSGLVNTNFVPGLTGVTSTGNWIDVALDGKDYVALELSGASDVNIGTFYFTFVSPTTGLLANTSFTVADGTVLKSLSIYSDSGIYAGQKNTLSFEAVDSDGKIVTSFDKLTDLVDFTSVSLGTISFVKLSDGSAKLVYDLTAATVSTSSSDKDSMSVYLTAALNEVATTSYTVKQVSLKVNEARVAKEVVGLRSGVYTAVAYNNNLTINATDLLIEDQYGNLLSKDDTKALATVKFVATPSSASNFDANAATVGLSNSLPGNGKLVFESKTAADASLNLSVGIVANDEFEVTLVTADATKATSLAIKSINDGKVVHATDVADHAGKLKTLIANVVTPLASTLEMEVTGSVAGKLLLIPATNYTIVGDTGSKLGDLSSTISAKTETATLTVSVHTAKGSVEVSKDYSYSNANPSITAIDDGTLTLAAGTVTATQLSSLFDFTDQYGDTVSSLGGVKYNVVDTTGVAKIINNNANTVTFTATAGVEYTITATAGSVSHEVTVKA